MSVHAPEFSATSVAPGRKDDAEQRHADVWLWQSGIWNAREEIEKDSGF